MTSSFTGNTNEEEATTSPMGSKPERMRERRSAVVDEFASRLRATPIKDM